MKEFIEKKNMSKIKSKKMMKAINIYRIDKHKRKILYFEIEKLILEEEIYEKGKFLTQN